MALKDPDDAVVALFKQHPIKNDLKSIKEGRPIFDDLEVCEIRFAGSRNVSVFPAMAVSHWRDDPITGEQIKITYAERFSRQYKQFKEQAQQTKSGTPLAHVPFLTEARRAELRALNIYTIEALAHVDGQELKNLGHAGRDLKNKAMEYIEEAKSNVPNLTVQAELEALRSRNAVLEEDAKLIAKQQSLQDSDKFDNMTLDQLREYITTNTGHAPLGTLNRKSLVRMATEAQQKAA